MEAQYVKKWRYSSSYFNCIANVSVPLVALLSKKIGQIEKKFAGPATGIRLDERTRARAVDSAADEFLRGGGYANPILWVLSPRMCDRSPKLCGDAHSPRLFDIASDQIKALRSRMLIGSIARGEVKGIIVRMGTSMRKFGLAPDVLKARLTDEESSLSLNYPTNLTRISEEDFDLLSRHGYEVSEATMNAHAAP